MHTITIHNRSGKNQEFECHGYNKNKNITVGGGKRFTFDAPDHTSGAIIALHDGHEGEQVEITKCGWQGNDTFDVSVIVGAGGNMTVQQVGDPSTRKGAPTFMQDLVHAWHSADEGTRRSLAGCVHCNEKGNPVRIDAPKANHELEKFVRRFADKKVYIGVGAWGDSKGVESDNQQSSAAHGSKDLIITYSDGDANPV